MEVDENQTPACKFSRVGNGAGREEEDGEIIRRAATANGGVGLGATAVADMSAAAAAAGGTANRLRGWHPSSRIIRVSRASGGKDRHSKVWTSKGLRDRRVRLSVTTAIQFYDLQDRLGYDQPSKAVEWLIKAASDEISELPSLNTSFPDTPKQLSDEKTEQGFDLAEVEFNGGGGVDPNCNNYQQNQKQSQSQHLSLSKSACSTSTSETSKNSSGLSLSKSEIRVNRTKARERAREKAAKEKEKESAAAARMAENHQNVNPISQNSSFTELLRGGIGGSSHVSNDNTSPNGESDFFNKARQSWPPPAVSHMDYFTTGLLGPSSSSSSSRTTTTHHHSSGFPGQIQLGNSLSSFNVVSGGDQNHQDQSTLQHFSFVPTPDNLIPVATTTATGGGGGGGGGCCDYNLNFTISSGLAGFNRGTLQSNSSSPSFWPHHLQRFSSIDGSSSSSPFYIATPPVENHHHQFPAGLDGRLQHCYGDPTRYSELHKGKGKN